MVVPSVLIEHWLVADMQTPDHEFYHALHAFFPSFLLLPVFFHLSTQVYFRQTARISDICLTDECTL